jgi:predicted outer membrane protein
MAALAMMATPIWAQSEVPSGRQELAEQQQVLDRDNNAQQGQPQQGQAQQGQRGQVQGQAQQGQRGQVQVQPRQGQQGQSDGQAQRASGEVDHRQVAEMFVLSNKAEIELSNMAADKTQNEQVRELAQQMVKDHTAFSAKLQKFAGKENDQADPPSASSHDGMARLQRKSAELELQMTKQMLSQYEGQDFDMGFLGQQTVAHTKMLACLTAAKDVGPQEFQATLEEGITTTREHLQHLKQIAATVKNKEYGEGQRRESARPDLREERREGVIRDGQKEGQIRDGGARPAVRPQDSDAPREGAPQRGTPQREGGARADDPSGTDGAPASARDRKEATP